MNLDQLAAKLAENIAEQAKHEVDVLERLATKALGVLQTQGVYALMLFLFSRSKSEEKVSQAIRNQLIAGIYEAGIVDNQQDEMPDEHNAQATLQFFSEKIAGGNLDALLFIRDLYEQALIYTRYLAKALEGTSTKSGS